ncbi:MAG TPA: hypothetical protein VFW66_13775 [Gemmatimonadales bacterium]|nr:hypothetical protein [Gemmatimonadales bacterium]
MPYVLHWWYAVPPSVADALALAASSDRVRAPASPTTPAAPSGSAAPEQSDAEKSARERSASERSAPDAQPLALAGDEGTLGALAP